MEYPSSPRSPCLLAPQPSSPNSSVSSSTVAVTVRGKQPASCTCKICGESFRNMFALAGHHNAHSTGKKSMKKRAATNVSHLHHDDPPKPELPSSLVLHPLKSTCIYKPPQGYRRGIASGYLYRVRSLLRYSFRHSVRSIIRSELPQPSPVRRPEVLPNQNPRNYTRNESSPSSNAVLKLECPPSISMPERSLASLRSPLPLLPLDALNALKGIIDLDTSDQQRTATASYLIKKYFAALRNQCHGAQVLTLHDDPCNLNRESLSRLLVAGSSGGCQNTNLNQFNAMTGQTRTRSTNAVPKEEDNWMGLDLNLNL